MKMPEPVGYLAWRDGKPCWEGEDCVCEDAVYPVDYDDDRQSKAIYSKDQMLDAMREVLEMAADRIDTANARRVVYTPDCIDIIRAMKEAVK